MELTERIAHRVTRVRRVDNPQSEPVQFNYRSKRFGYCNYQHTVGDGDSATPIYKKDYPQWEAVEFSHPAYLDQYWSLAYDSYRGISQSPEERGQSTIADYEKELHEDLSKTPEEQKEKYIQNYKKYFSAWLSAQGRCLSAFITGPSGFNTRRSEKANTSSDNRYKEFREWRERAIKAIKELIERNKPEAEKMNEEWESVRRGIDRSATIIHDINTGKDFGNKALFVSNLVNRIETHANNGNVEIVDKAIAYIREWNAKVKKPIVTERNKLFKFPEVARNVRGREEAKANQENKEVRVGNVTVVWNYEIDRLQILFDEIPDKDTRTRLHREFSFNWSPTNAAWQRKLTDNAVRAAKRFLNVETF